jgi:type II secretory pathway pseudopilin PulG
MSILDSRFSILDWSKQRVFPRLLRAVSSRREESASAASATRESRIENRRNEPSARPGCSKSKSPLAFSLVEVLAAVALIGIITFLALPNIVRIKQDGEESLAIARAEAINLSMASYIQAHGQDGAASDWSTATTADARYAKLAPYLAFAPSTLAAYMPGGYSVTLPTTLLPLSKVTLTGPSGTISY